MLFVVGVVLVVASPFFHNVVVGSQGENRTEHWMKCNAKVLRIIKYILFGHEHTNDRTTTISNEGSSATN